MSRGNIEALQESIAHQPSMLPRIENLGRLLGEAANVQVAQVTDSVGIGYAVLNRHLLGEVQAIVAPGSFLSAIKTPDRAYEGILLANGGSTPRPVMLVDMPSHGASSPHSRDMVVDLTFRRKSDLQVAPMLEAVLQVVGDDTPIDYFGISHAGHAALRLTELDPTDRVGTVFGLDIAAVKRRITVALNFGFLFLDNHLGRKDYRRLLSGSQAEADYEFFKELYPGMDVSPARSAFRKNPGLFIMNLFASVNARPVALDAWKNIMENKSSRVEVYTGSDTHVSCPRAIGKFISLLPPEQALRSKQIIMEGEDHNIGMSELLPRAASWAHAAYDRVST